ncbi:hypothetical protein ACLOJK_040971 [Asimina triloba]
MTDFSPVGHYFASSSHDRTARIWSMDKIQPLRIMAGHLSDVDKTDICVQWHANCNYIATGSSDKTVRLWDVQSGECVRIFVGHRSMILSLAMSPDGRYMASGDEDGTIMMWDLSSGRCVTPLMGHTSCVWTLSFSGEGSLLASGSADCTVKLWDVTASTKPPRTEDNSPGGIFYLQLVCSQRAIDNENPFVEFKKFHPCTCYDHRIDGRHTEFYLYRLTFGLLQAEMNKFMVSLGLMSQKVELSPLESRGAT